MSAPHNHDRDPLPGGQNPVLTGSDEAADPDDTEDDGPDVTVVVELTVTETVSYEFRSEVEVPACVAADQHELHDYLADNEDLWLDDLDPTGRTSDLCINERSLDQVELAA
ncbi:hypothetical protein [Streptomyces flavofungini]|uniref:hypothetical protein n=1 Tax=Streptomyces flavofungini TaxID=68200 RepID=UPI0025B0A910|nr:hypothetical protein [Streptomyces flavofungini]WJV51717.1 hypothetical protein QUY26_40370 [Streptomyces flavofungini]